jgi:transposase
MNKNQPTVTHQARVKRPERFQITWEAVALDHLLPSDHRARIVWRFVDALDLSPLYMKIKAVEGSAGRDAVDPKILMALWMFATIEGVSSARQLDTLCTRDVAYKWICGTVGVNYHMLSDFRTDHGEILDQLLTDTVATLMHQGLITLEVVAQDGMRVRAHAGSSSFRRRPTLEKCRDEAAEQVRRLREESAQESNRDASNARREAARARAALERADRIAEALKELDKLQKQKEKRKKGTGEQARCSTTDPEARNMKMANGGFRPAYNVQFATDGKTRMIVGVEVTNSGSDRGEMDTMHEQVSDRYDKLPDDYLVDGGFATKDDITAVEKRGTKVLAPIHGEKQMRDKGTDPHARQRGDTDEMFTFRQRMATDEAKQLYKQRPSIAEFPNAECRNRGLQQFRVRGLQKVKAVTLWYALTFNFMRMMNLGCIE